MRARATKCMFVRGTTEAINLVAQSYARPLLKSGDEILITYLEHHANIVPWQIVCEQTGAKLVVAPMDARGEVHVAEVEALMNPRTRLFAFAHVSNALGTVLPVRRLVAAAKARGITTLVDGAQAVPHMAGRRAGARTAISTPSPATRSTGPPASACCTGAKQLLEKMPPWQGGGDMILSVSFKKTTYNALPYKFEAGTPNISGAIGLGRRRGLSGALGFGGRRMRTNTPCSPYATETLSKIDGLRIVGTARDKASLVSFVVAGVHPHDLGTILDEDGVAIRTGHHCAMPVMDYLQIAGHGPGVVCLLQHLRGNRPLERCHWARPQDICLKPGPHGTQRPVSRCDPRSQSHTAKFRRVGARGCHCGRIQPSVRRSPHRARQNGRRTDFRHSLRGTGLRHFHGFGIPDDRSGEGQEPHRRLGIVRACSSQLLTDDAPRRATSWANWRRYPAFASIRPASNARACAGIRWSPP